jgi:3-phenylpropionate/cinnamic acid dioxygenase small subunit
VGDRDEIAALVHAYAELLDGGDLDGVAHLFDRATWRAGSGSRSGFEAVRPIYDRVILYDGVPRTKHVISNLDVFVDGSTATARSYFTVLQAAPDRPLQPIMAGRYHDAFARDARGWYFTERLILDDLSGDLSAHYV